MTPDLIPLNNIIVEKRMREDFGDIGSLMTSIRKHGLLHAIVVDADNRLVAGGRRLAAVRNLGWQSVPVRRLGDLTEHQRREVELEENIRRKDLTPYERSKYAVELVDTAKAVVRRELSTDSVGNSMRGRPVDPTSDARIADRIGMSPQSIGEARQHVAAVEANPEMETWPQRQVLDHVRQQRRGTVDQVDRTSTQDADIVRMSGTDLPARALAKEPTTPAEMREAGSAEMREAGSREATYTMRLDDPVAAAESMLEQLDREFLEALTVELRLGLPSYHTLSKAERQKYWSRITRSES